jgi:hypothetical protein
MVPHEDIAMADPADDDLNQPNQETADAGIQDGQQPLGDTAEARPTDEGQVPEQAGDDSDQTSDPLVLAQMEPETRADEQPGQPAKPVAPKPTTTSPKPNAAATKPGKEAQPAAKPEQAKPAAKDEQDDSEMAEALGDLPAEDWSKVSHKAKSQFLAQRKVLKSQREAIATERKAREEAEQRYQAVDVFVRDHGLSNEEYVNSVTFTGMIKRNDPRMIPVLENTLKALRKATGQPEPVATPQLDDDLNALLLEAEDMGLDTGKVRASYKPKAPAAAAQQQQPAQTAPAERQAAPEARREPAGDGGDEENMRIITYLQRRGIADPVARVAELIAANPELANKPLGERYEAIIEAHSTGGVKQQPQRRQATTPTLSGRGGPVRAAGNTGPIDPLKHAIRR